MSNINQIVNTFKKKGIAKGKAEILSIDEIQKLQELILDKKNKYLEKNEVYHNIIGIDKNIDKLIEKVLTNLEIKTTLEKILGKDYLLRLCSVRYNEPNDKGLALHQDSIGEIGLMILLNDQPDGSTVFFPGSQLIPSDKHLASKVSWNSLKLSNISKFFLFAGKGKAGDYFYIHKRTWHGRKPGLSKKTKMTIFISFYPVSAKRSNLCFVDPKFNKVKDKYSTVLEPNLKKIISRENYYSAIKTFDKEINSNNALSMRLNTFDNLINHWFYLIWVILKVLLLEILFFPIFLKRFFKK
jgi:putative 2OG-Fe(II) oxygenase